MGWLPPPGIDFRRQFIVLWHQGGQGLPGARRTPTSLRGCPSRTLARRSSRPVARAAARLLLEEPRAAPGQEARPAGGREAGPDDLDLAQRPAVPRACRRRARAGRGRRPGTGCAGASRGLSPPVPLHGPRVDDPCAALWTEVLALAIGDARRCPRTRQEFILPSPATPRSSPCSTSIPTWWRSRAVPELQRRWAAADVHPGPSAPDDRAGRIRSGRAALGATAARLGDTPRPPGRQPASPGRDGWILRSRRSICHAAGHAARHGAAARSSTAWSSIWPASGSPRCRTASGLGRCATASGSRPCPMMVLDRPLNLLRPDDAEREAIGRRDPGGSRRRSACPSWRSSPTPCTACRPAPRRTPTASAC